MSLFLIHYLPLKLKALLTSVLLFDTIESSFDLSFLGGYFKNIFVDIIWVLFFLAVYFSVRYLSRLRRKQEPALRQVQANLQAVSKGVEHDTALVKAALLNNVSGDSVIAARIGELHVISRRGGDFEQVALAETLAASESSRTSFTRYVASVLVLLGLCGAIYGLSNLVLQMGPELRKMQELSRQTSAVGSNAPTTPTQNTSLTSIQESVSTLIETMANSLEHTRGAFAASLTGIGCSIALLFFNWFVGRKQVDFLTEVETLTATKLIPLFKPLPPAFELSGAVNSFNAGAQLAARMAHELEGVVESGAQHFQNLFFAISKFEQGARAIEESQQSVADAQSKMLAIAEQFTNVTEGIAKYQESSKDDISGVVSAVNDSNESIKKAIEEWRAKHQEVLGQLDNVVKKAYTESKEAKQETKQILEQYITTYSDKIIETLNNQQKSNQDHLNQMIEAQKQHIDTLQRAILDGQGHKELVDGLNEVLAEERGDFSTKFRELIEPQQKNLAEQLTAIIGRQEKLFKRLESLSASLTEPLGDAGASRSHAASPQNLQAIIQQHQETNRAVRRVSHYAQRLIAVSVMLVSGAAGAAFFVGALTVWRMLDGWPAAPGGQVLSLILLLAVSVAIFYALSSVLLRDSDD
jgi:hypothetical protein